MMKRIFFILIFLFSISFSQERILVGNEPVIYEIKIDNNNPNEELFLISVFPQEYFGVKAIYNDRVWIKPFSSSILQITFVSGKCVEDIKRVFEISAYQFSDPSKKYSTKLEVLPKRESTICLTSLNLSDSLVEPEKNLIITSKIKNFGKTDLQLRVKIFVEDKKIYDSIITLEKLSEEVIQQSFFVSKSLKPGKYSVKVLVYDMDNKLIDMMESQFEIAKVITIEQMSFNKASFMESTNTIKFKNSGNVESNTQYYSIFIPKILQPFVKISADYIKQDDLYKIIIPSLKPGQEFSFSFSVVLYPIWIVAAIIIASIIFIYFKYYTILIEKRIFEKEGEFKVKIQVKNARKMKLKNVVLIDRVPALFKLSKEFEFFEPKIVKKATGFELIWEIGDLNPGEERIITYKIKPIIELVGKFKLPKAILKFKEGRAEKQIAISKSVSI